MGISARNEQLSTSNKFHWRISGECCTRSRRLSCFSSLVAYTLLQSVSHDLRHNNLDLMKKPLLQLLACRIFLLNCVHYVNLLLLIVVLLIIIVIAGVIGRKLCAHRQPDRKRSKRVPHLFNANDGSYEFLGNICGWCVAFVRVCVWWCCFSVSEQNFVRFEAD